MRIISTVLVVLAAASFAGAQEKGLKKGKPGKPLKPDKEFGRASGARWYSSIDALLRFGKARPRYILVYVGTPGESDTPRALYGGDIVTAADSGQWGFVHLLRDSEDAWQRSAGVSRAPAIVGCDGMGNPFKMNPQPNIYTVKNMIRTLPGEVERYAQQLASEFKRVSNLARNDPGRAVAGMIKLVREGKPGYPQIDEALNLIRETGAAELERATLAESVGPAEGIEFLEGIVKTYGRTPPGVKAEIRIAKLEMSRQDFAAALRRLEAIAGYDPRYIAAEQREAARARDEILAAARETVKPPAEPMAEPSPSEQRTAETELRARYQRAFSDRSPEGRAVLAQTLLTEGRDLPSSPAARYVALREARTAAVGAGDLETAMAAVDVTALWFAIDPVALKVDLLSNAARTARAPEQAAPVARAFLALARGAVDREDFDAALRAAKSAETAARRAKDVALVTRARRAVEEVEAIEKDFRAVEAHRNTLKTSPDDAVANGQVGLFLCLVKGDWETGLPHLAKGADASVKMLATNDLADPADAAAQASVGDGWWSLAALQTRIIRKTHALERAVHWYVKAETELTGLNKLKVEQRLKEVAQLMPKAVRRGPMDLLSRVDLERHAKGGTWSRVGQAVVVNMEKKERTILVLPAVPPEEYDLRVVASRTDGEKSLVIGLVAGGKQFVAFFDAEQRSSFGLIDREWAYTSRIRKDPSFKLAYKDTIFRPGRDVTIVCSVRRNAFTVTVDGAEMFNWTPDWSLVSLHKIYEVPNNETLFLGANSPFRISEVTLTPVTGTPRLIH